MKIARHRFAIVLAALALAAGCDEPSDALPGSVYLTVRVDGNCGGIADTVDVKVNDLFFATVVAGDAGFTKRLAPMQYSITAASRNGAKQWSETRNLLSDYTFVCDCR